MWADMKAACLALGYTEAMLVELESESKRAAPAAVSGRSFLCFSLHFRVADRLLYAECIVRTQLRAGGAEARGPKVPKLGGGGLVAGRPMAAAAAGRQHTAEFDPDQNGVWLSGSQIPLASPGAAAADPMAALSPRAFSDGSDGSDGSGGSGGFDIAEGQEWHKALPEAK